MNERIRELAVAAAAEQVLLDQVMFTYSDEQMQAFEEVMSKPLKDNAAVMKLLATRSPWEAWAQQFAELIIIECVDCLAPLSRNHSIVGAAQDTIKEHFGVK